jgi:hypothetical protein
MARFEFVHFREFSAKIPRLTNALCVRPNLRRSQSHSKSPFCCAANQRRVELFFNKGLKECLELSQHLDILNIR